MTIVSLPAATPVGVPALAAAFAGILRTPITVRIQHDVMAGSLHQIDAVGGASLPDEVQATLGARLADWTSALHRLGLFPLRLDAEMRLGSGSIDGPGLSADAVRALRGQLAHHLTPDGAMPGDPVAVVILQAERADAGQVLPGASIRLAERKVDLDQQVEASWAVSQLIRRNGPWFGVFQKIAILIDVTAPAALSRLPARPCHDRPGPGTALNTMP